MIKKTLILASVMAFTMSSTVFAETTPVQTPQKSIPATKIEAAKPSEMQKTHRRGDFKQKNAEFEKRLKLTEKQKEEAKQIRLKGHEKMKPIMEQIKAKHQEADAVRKSRIAHKMQEEKLQKIHLELRELRKQVHEIRTQNLKEFEAILTNKQKKELEKIKKEGRDRFEKNRKLKYGERHDKPEFGPKPVKPCPLPQPVE